MVSKIELEIEDVKGLREDLCVVQSALAHYGDQFSRRDRIQKIIDQLDIMRPLGPDGKHGDRHTLNCGCELYDVNSLYPKPFPEPTPEQEVEFIDRIIAGQPMLPLLSSIEEGFMEEVGAAIQKMYKESVPKSSISIVFPDGTPIPSAPRKMVVHWHRIPRFDNYEINMYGEIRNRFTRRVLELEKTMTGKYVDMHDKDGFPHLVCVDHIVKEMFGEAVMPKQVDE